MNRRHFLSSMGIAGAAAMTSETALFAAGETNTAPSASISALVDGTPVVYAVTESAATLVWTPKVPARGWIELGESRDNLQPMRSDAFGFVPHDERVIKVRIRDLKPGTRYWWRSITEPLSGGEQTVSPPYSFQTLNSAASETHFAVWNDTHDRAETIRKLAALTQMEPADFLVWNGDVSNNIEKIEVVGGLYVHPVGTNLAEGPPLFLSRGNHDVRGLWANKVSDYVGFPQGRPYYAFRSGPLAVLVLDTGEDKPDKHPSFRGMAAFEPLIEEQKRWLARVIQRPAFKNAPYRLVFCHIPLRLKTEVTPDYDKGGFDWFSRRGRNAWHESLVSWGAQTIVSGHIHGWAYLPETTEFPYAQLIGGGPEARNATLIRGHATEKELKLAVYTLDGRELHSATIPPRMA
jgi:hypothetical protein